MLIASFNGAGYTRNLFLRVKQDTAFSEHGLNQSLQRIRRAHDWIVDAARQHDISLSQNTRFESITLRIVCAQFLAQHGVTDDNHPLYSTDQAPIQPPITSYERTM